MMSPMACEGNSIVRIIEETQVAHKEHVSDHYEFIDTDGVVVSLARVGGEVRATVDGKDAGLWQYLDEVSGDYETDDMLVGTVAVESLPYLLSFLSMREARCKRDGSSISECDTEEYDDRGSCVASSDSEDGPMLMLRRVVSAPSRMGPESESSFDESLLDEQVQPEPQVRPPDDGPASSQLDELGRVRAHLDEVGRPRLPFDRSINDAQPQGSKEPQQFEVSTPTPLWRVSPYTAGYPFEGSFEGMSLPTANLTFDRPFDQPLQSATLPSGGKQVAQEHSSPACEGFTTVMIRNIPNDYTRDDHFLPWINSVGLSGTYDFVYLPCDIERGGTNLGYAFVNFKDHQGAKVAFERLTGFTDWRLEKGVSKKECEVVWNHESLQGRDAMENKYRNRAIMHPDISAKYKPIVFENASTYNLLQPTKTIKKPKAKKMSAPKGKKASTTM